MRLDFSPQAVETVALLQQGQRSGTPVLIPGALEMRARPPASAWRQDIDVPVVPPRPSTGVSAAEPLTFGAGLRQSMRHPLRIPAIWRRFLSRAA